MMFNEITGKTANEWKVLVVKRNVVIETEHLWTLMSVVSIIVFYSYTLYLCFSFFSYFVVTKPASSFILAHSQHVTQAKASNYRKTQK